MFRNNIENIVSENVFLKVFYLGFRWVIDVINLGFCWCFNLGYERFIVFVFEMFIQYVRINWFYMDMIQGFLRDVMMRWKLLYLVYRQENQDNINRNLCFLMVINFLEILLKWFWKMCFINCGEKIVNFFFLVYI